MEVTNSSSSLSLSLLLSRTKKTGIGGVVMTPSLLVAGVEAKLAIVSLFVAFTPTVYVRVYLLHKYTRCVPWKCGFVVGFGSALGSTLSGALLLDSAPRGVLTYLIAAISLLAGFRDFRGLYLLHAAKKKRALEEVEMSAAAVESPPGEGDEQNQQREVAAVVDKDAYENMTALEQWSEPTHKDLVILFIIGVLVGLISVLTGTGGPITFLPMVIVWKGDIVHRKVLITLSAVMSAALGTGAIISTLATGIDKPDGGLCLLITSFALIGVCIGVRLLEFIRRETLQLGMGFLLLAIGGFILHQAITKY